MEAEIFLHVEKIIIMLSERAKQKLIGLWDQHIYNFIFTFPELTFYDFFASTTPKHLHLG
jgi:hypothetical protein